MTGEFAHSICQEFEKRLLEASVPIARLFDAYPELNLHWLLIGEELSTAVGALSLAVESILSEEELIKFNTLTAIDSEVANNADKSDATT